MFDLFSVGWGRIQEMKIEFHLMFITDNKNNKLVHRKVMNI